MKASGLLAILVLLVGVVLFLFISIIIGAVVIIVGLIMMYFSRKNSNVQTGQPGAKPF